MEDGAVDLREGFVRQRRSLVAVSLAWLLYQTSGVVIDHLNVFGNKLDLKTPELAGTVLWVAWLYFLLRYYQYFRDLPDKGVSTAFGARLITLMRKVARNEIKRQCKLKGPWQPVDEIELEKARIDTIGSYKRFWEFRVTELVAIISPNNRPLHQFSGKTIKVEGSRLIAAKLRSAAHVSLNTRFLTEYYLPFVLAAAPLSLFIWRLYLGAS